MKLHRTPVLQRPHPGVPCRAVEGAQGTRLSCGCTASCSSRQRGGRCPCAVSRGEGGAGAQSSKARTQDQDQLASPGLSQAVGCWEDAVAPSMEAAPMPLCRAGEQCEHQDQKPLADWVRDGVPPPPQLNSRLMTTKGGQGAGPTGPTAPNPQQLKPATDTTEGRGLGGNGENLVPDAASPSW